MKRVKITYEGAYHHAINADHVCGINGEEIFLVNKNKDQKMKQRRSHKDTHRARFHNCGSALLNRYGCAFRWANYDIIKPLM